MPFVNNALYARPFLQPNRYSILPSANPLDGRGEVFLPGPDVAAGGLQTSCPIRSAMTWMGVPASARFLPKVCRRT